MKKTFKEWMDEVNKLLEAKCGLSADDLPDVCYRDMYDAGKRPSTAANAAWRNARDEY
jgi:hypothetical protein